MKASRFSDARENLEDWCRHYNEVRPHRAIRYNVPIALHYPNGVTSPSSCRRRRNIVPGDPELGSIESNIITSASSRLFGEQYETYSVFSCNRCRRY
ncbi:integrase core domain-containing protein [Palleronia caenipelagi]|uniref:Transposase n=1 Tax=Palleronia caenipelagi TaxID=2489174 RepID=A0A547PT86_9RHOB|nr:transposase [Palleronia caenipelagi]